jgi:hypothetical protein
MDGGLFIHAVQRQIPVATQATTASAIVGRPFAGDAYALYPGTFGLKHLVRKNLFTKLAAGPLPCAHGQFPQSRGAC